MRCTAKRCRFVMYDEIGLITFLGSDAGVECAGMPLPALSAGIAAEGVCVGLAVNGP